MLTNRSPDPIDFHLFLSSRTELDISLDLEGFEDLDTVAWVAPEIIRHTSGRGGVLSSAVTAGPTPTRYQIGGNILGSLADGSPTSLESPIDNPGVVFLRRNIQWAWQWDLELPTRPAVALTVHRSRARGGHPAGTRPGMFGPEPGLGPQPPRPLAAALLPDSARETRAMKHP